MYLNRVADLKLNFLIAILLIIGFTGCNSNSSKGVIAKADTLTDTLKEDLLIDGSVKKLIVANHHQLLNIKGDLKSFSLYVDKLDNKKVSSIPFALDYINTCLAPSDPSVEDSLFLIFNLKFYAVANALTERLDSQYEDQVSDIAKDSPTVTSKSFENNIAVCGMGLFSTEGNYYADVQPEYFYNNFKDRVSPATKDFLRIRKKELKEGFSEDAGMLISFDSLYSRVTIWENFLNSYPNSLYYVEAENYYFTYLETLMTGMDNSRVFVGDNNTISPEIKSLYERIMNEKPASKASQTISSYYNCLAMENFRQTDKIDSFLNEKHLSSMLGIQPHLR